MKYCHLFSFLFFVVVITPPLQGQKSSKEFVVLSSLKASGKQLSSLLSTKRDGYTVSKSGVIKALKGHHIIFVKSSRKVMITPIKNTQLDVSKYVEILELDDSYEFCGTCADCHWHTDRGSSYCRGSCDGEKCMWITIFKNKDRMQYQTEDGGGYMDGWGDL